MNLLLDTHVLLWWLDDNPLLSSKAKKAISDWNNIVFVSAVVIWEIRIKQALGKLIIPSNFRKVLSRQPFEMLDITVDHADAIKDLPFHHRDPFDRLLIAQAKVERLTLVTHDLHLKKYKVPILKA
ncbi:MAG: type II toxin-antitoxin system VapC family toxin [Deltaproteobacteria bacterium]|nr:type II toxin-antitoxin system VapC family toxin [Deltaproteobacteria bacterium]MBW2017609.1 type II toxin-antitoxin system VapC family toxin [Deltaproteobacteria bacterium]MBW2128404.1 type II toxin-antitoxin system VapC family toxin [Deltaproteobacteria bacterium]MBW2304370.1 type II toxin-antitoxin system VapC family toxin [Deltaproteobacteria bacterium]